MRRGRTAAQSLTASRTILVTRANRAASTSRVIPASAGTIAGPAAARVAVAQVLTAAAVAVVCIHVRAAVPPVVVARAASASAR